MKYCKLMVMTATLMGPAMAWAGGGVAVRAVSSAPALDEAGLIALGVGLVGAGVAFLRKR
jgi:hypothetical protein